MLTKQRFTVIEGGPMRHVPQHIPPETYRISLEAVVLMKPPLTMNERAGFTYAERMEACFAGMRRDTPGPVWKAAFEMDSIPQRLETRQDEGMGVDSPFHATTSTVRMWWEADLTCETLSKVHQHVSQMQMRMRPFVTYWNGKGWRMTPVVRLCSAHSERLENYVAAHGARIGLSLQPNGKGWHHLALPQ